MWLIAKTRASIGGAALVLALSLFSSKAATACCFGHTDYFDDSQHSNFVGQRWCCCGVCIWGCGWGEQTIYFTDYQEGGCGGSGARSSEAVAKLTEKTRPIAEAAWARADASCPARKSPPTTGIGDLNDEQSSPKASRLTTPSSERGRKKSLPR